MNKFPAKSYLLLLLFLGYIGGVALAQESPYNDLIAKVGTSEDNGGADIVAIFDSTDIEVEESGLAHINIHTLTKVLTEAGAQGQAVKRFDYDPASNMVEIKKVAIHRADGKMEEIDVAQAVDCPQPQHMIYWGTRMKLLEVPNLKVGDAVETAYYTKGFMIAYLSAQEDESRYIPPMKGHYYDTVYFGTGYPIKHKVYLLKTPKDKPVQFKVYNGDITTSVTFNDKYNIYTYEKKDIPVYRPEPRAPAEQDYIPKVVLATVKDWFEKSRWFYLVNEESVIDIYGMKVRPFEWESSPELIAKVKEITAPYKTDAEKRWAIVHWVAQHIRYSGISMGKGEGYTLHPGIMTFRDRCGVCKDIAGMCITMFRAAGYKSYPTMTMAGARVERIPADQFNHCVVAVDISGEPGVKSDNLPGTKYEMYDPTWIPNAMDVWSRAEGDQHIVIGSPEGEDLTKIRPYSAEENRFNITSRATIDKNGDLLGTLEIKALGYADGRLRRVIVYTGGSEDIWNRIANYISGIAPGAELTGYEHDDDQDFSKPMGLRINYKIPGYAIQYGDGLHFTSPSARFLPATSFLFQTFAIASLDKRTQPILAYSPWQVVMDETINVPKGYKLGEFKPVNKGGDFADFKASVKSASGTVKVAFEYKVTDRYVQPEQYPQVKEIVDGMNEFAHTNINLWSK